MAEFQTKNITYFLKTGISNTDKAISLAVERVAEGDITKVVVATSSGDTGLKVYDAFKDTDGVDVVPVVLNAGSKYSAPDGEWTKNKGKYDKLGLKYVQSIHAFSGIERAVKSRWNTAGPALLIGDALKLSGEGFKVCVEIAVMACDCGAVAPVDKVLVLSGSGHGADTCLVVRPAYSSSFFDFAIQEIVCKPITHGIKHEAR
ncbi:MAG: hypothetical protein KAI18_03200 [Candidatus Aenigmarchaeota archaeon]|nr:hypothetical protein [Candidatus Aenigmarchaeota archaeon]